MAFWTTEEATWNYWNNYQWEERTGQHCEHVVAFAYSLWRKAGRKAA